VIGVSETGSESVIVHLGAIPDNVRGSVRSKLSALAIETQNHIQRDKLSGQVLKVRTGTARRSVHATPAQDEGDMIVAKVASGREAWYLAVHEYGAHIPPVEGKLMVFESGGETVFTRRRRGFDLPARAPMRTGLSEMRSRIVSEVASAAKEGAHA